jgi:hypothetical protein
MKIYNQKTIAFFKPPFWKKNFKILLLVFLVGACIMGLLQFLFIERVPEKEMVMELLQHNNVVQEYFGSIEKISYDSTQGASISSSIGGVKEGYFFYQVEGVKKKGVVKVDWQKNKTEELRITEIKVVVPEEKQLIIK